jgi:hypothetical protein
MGSTTVSVASSVYNVAGDIDKRPNFLKLLVYDGITNKEGRSLADTLTNGYLFGSGIRLRNFNNWAEGSSGFTDLIGLTTGTLAAAVHVDTTVVADSVDIPVGEVIQVSEAVILRNDVTRLAREYIRVNYPSEEVTGWTAEYLNPSIEITFADTATVSYTPIGYNPLVNYLYVTYQTSPTPYDTPLVTGDTVIVPTGDDFPVMTGWTLTDSITVEITLDLVTTTTTNTAGVITVSSTSTPTSYDRTTITYKKNTVLSTGELSIERLTEYHITGKKVIVTTTTSTSGTTTTTVDTESLEDERKYYREAYTSTIYEWGAVQTFVYEKGTGKLDLDALFPLEDTSEGFYPFIPLRLNNVPVSGEIYNLSKRAFRKAVGTNTFDKVLAKIEDNPDVGDIDYCYTVFGVSLNTKEQAGKEYIYRFLKAAINTGSNSLVYAQWETEFEAAVQTNLDWEAWKAGLGELGVGDPITPEPPTATIPPLPNGYLWIKSNSSTVMRYDMMIRWSSLDEDVGVGLKKPDAKRGELWWGTPTNQIFAYWEMRDGDRYQYHLIPIETITLNWQVTLDTWKSITVRNLDHINNVYNGKVIGIVAGSALADVEESGFLIPLHSGIYRELGVVKGTQLATSCCYLVFNSYAIVKRKWYQTSWFKFLIVILIIVIAANTGGADLNTLILGLSTGAVGTTALIIGATAEALAGLVLSALIAKLEPSFLRNDKLKLILALAFILRGDLTSVGKLMSATQAALGSYSNYLLGNASKLNIATADLLTKTAIELARIAKARGELDTGDFDLLKALNVIPYELPETFLERTLLTGTEIAELTLTLETSPTLEEI